MKVLVDTSVWVAHFRVRNQQLAALLSANRVLCHPLVCAEIACSTPPAPRQATLRMLSQLGQANVAGHHEVMAFIEQHRLYDQGCGFVDIALLASARITPSTQLWTQDQALAALAQAHSVRYMPELA